MPRFAARHLLPMEMAVALLASIPVGMSAWFGHGLLWRVLADSPRFMGITHNVWWGAAFVGFGAALLAVSAGEWLRGRTWDGDRLRCAAAKRAWFAMMLAICHLALVWQLLASGHLLEVFSIAAATPAAVLLLSWSVYRLACLLIVLDPAIPSERIERNWRAERW